MDRSARLEYCEKCTKREYSPIGIVCSLTKEHATFIGFCNNYQEDEKEAELLENKKILQKEDEAQEETLGLSKIGIKDGTLAGIIIIVAAIAWFVIGLVYLNRIFIYPPFLLVFGVFALVRGLNKRKKNRFAKELLDRDF